MVAVKTEQLIEEYQRGDTLAQLAETHGFKSANSVYMRLRRYGFNQFRRNFGHGLIEYHRKVASCPRPTLTAA